MSKKKEGGFFSQIKNQIITGVGIAITAGSTLFLDVVKEKLGLIDPPTETIEIVEQPNQPQEIIINIPEQKPVETKTVIIKEVEKKAPPKKTETEKRKEEGLDW